ncbi:MAG: YjiH family protein [Clostridium sp.]
MLISSHKKYSLKWLLSFLLFFIPSLMGVLFFMTPIKVDGEITIPVAFLSNKLVDVLADTLPLIAVIFICTSFIGSLIFKISKKMSLSLTNIKVLSSLFDVSPVWFVVRLLGSVFVVLSYFEIGPEMINSTATGGLVLYDLLPILFAVFLFAGFFLPLLLSFGLLEFIGSLLTKVMRPIFKLPGRASIDCITSWLGDGSIGILLTSKQYEEGFYTKREAAVIGTTFSAVSITFSLVIISQVGLSHMFIPFYFVVSIAGIVAAIIIPRIPPLSRKPDTYINGKESKGDAVIPEGYTSLTYGLENAIKRAESNCSIKRFFTDGITNVLDMWIGVLPVVMAMGTLALIVAEYTPVFQYLGMPFIPFLELLGIPEAAAASQTLMVGFADMFIPSVLATSITSELTRFIIACVSVSQLIFMSEVGGLLLGSKIPVNFKDLVIIFILRTVITLPVITLLANFIF